MRRLILIDSKNENHLSQVPRIFWKKVDGKYVEMTRPEKLKALKEQNNLHLKLINKAKSPEKAVSIAIISMIALFFLKYLLQKLHI